MRPNKPRREDWIELNLMRWLSVRAQGIWAINAAVLLVLWLTALGFVYLLWHA